MPIPSFMLDLMPHERKALIDKAFGGIPSRTVHYRDSQSLRAGSLRLIDSATPSGRSRKLVESLNGTSRLFWKGPETFKTSRRKLKENLETFERENQRNGFVFGTLGNTSVLSFTRKKGLGQNNLTEFQKVVPPPKKSRTMDWDIYETSRTTLGGCFGLIYH